MPKRSSLASAYSRHSPRTSHAKHTFLASRVEPPFSGKNASGSVCAHKVWCPHVVKLPPLLLGPPGVSRISRRRK
jgi:hypothetical protein